MAEVHINKNYGWAFKWKPEEDEILRNNYPANGYSRSKRVTSKQK